MFTVKTWIYPVKETNIRSMQSLKSAESFFPMNFRILMLGKSFSI